MPVTPPPKEGLRILVLEGGGFKGAFQVPILRALDPSGYDIVLGNSIGALNGVFFACGEMDALADIWAKVDDDHPVNGVTGFSKPCILGGRAFYSVSPVKELLQKHISKKKLKVRYGCSATRREDDLYHIFMGEDCKGDAALHDAVLASAAIAAAFEPVVISQGPLKGTWSDGGHRHSFPMFSEEATWVDVVLLTPTEQVKKARKEVDKLLEAVVWMVELAADLAHANDRERLMRLVGQGLRGRVFAPSEHLGGLLDSSKEKIQWRTELGRKALANPTILGR